MAKSKSKAMRKARSSGKIMGGKISGGKIAGAKRAKKKAAGGKARAPKLKPPARAKRLRARTPAATVAVTEVEVHQFIAPAAGIAPTGSAPAGSAPARFTRIHLLSDSTGNLGQHMLSAFLTQFPPRTFDVRRHNFLSTPTRVLEALAAVQDSPGMVLHAFVSADSKEVIHRICEALGMPACDLTGEFVEFLRGNSGIEPAPNVHLLHDISDEYHQRIKALEFTLEHDDGLGLDTVHEADIVLAGVSRTSKTPTSIYLAQLGYKVANVSLAKAVAPPRQLLELMKKSVVGLLIDPLRLSEIRTNRQHSWGMSDTTYNQLDYVQEEVEWSRKIFMGKGWPTLDVTRRAVEETAGKVVELLGLGKGR